MKKQHKQKTPIIIRTSVSKSIIMSSIVTVSNFQTKSVTISPLKALQSGAKQAYVSYTGERLLMQSAVSMTVPFGLNISEFGAAPEYSVNLSFRGAEQSAEIKQFLEAMNQLDEFMIGEGVKNSKAWFKADLSKDVIKAFYTPCVKYSKDKDGNVLPYPPNLKLKLRKTDGQFEAKFYDVKGKPYSNVPIEDLLVKGVQVTAIMECGGVWFAGSKFGLTWRAKQIAIHKLPEKIGDFAFKGLASASPVEDEEEEKQPSYKKPTSKVAEIDDEAVFAATATATATKTSAVAAMMPQAQAQAPTPTPVAAQEKEKEDHSSESSSHAASTVDDEDADDLEPVPAPKKMVVKKKVVTKH
jgi:hypothetical protein